MPLGEVIAADPSLIPVIGRFGIRLGVGELSIAEVAAAHGIDPGFLTAILNIFTDEGYFPEKKLRSLEVALVVDYLHKTNGYYLAQQLPNIGRHLQAFIARSSVTNNSLEMLGRLFETFRQGLQERIAYDEQELFPTLLAGRHAPRYRTADESEELLAEMINIMVRHLTGDYDMNLCYAVVFALSSLRRDVACHRRLRERILYSAPRSGRRTMKESAPGQELTAREIEVLRLIARGKINREIAEELFIGFQTVLTHRKNITAKLGIKSVSGLTMYALMRGYI